MPKVGDEHSFKGGYSFVRLRYMLYINHGMVNILPETEVRGSLQ